MFLKKTGETYDRQRKKCTGKQLKGLAIPIYLHDRRLCFFTMICQKSHSEVISLHPLEQW